MLCYVMLCYVMLCYVMLCYVMLCYVMLCYVMLCYVMLCYVMLCYVMLCYVNNKKYFWRFGKSKLPSKLTERSESFTNSPEFVLLTLCKAFHQLYCDRSLPFDIHEN